MALISYIFGVFLITSGNTVDLKPLPEDITEILQKVIEQIEITKRNKVTRDTPISAIASNNSQIYYTNANNDYNHMQEIADAQLKNFDKSESKSPIFPTLQQNADILENAQSSESLINENDSTINQQELEEKTSHIDKIIDNNNPSRRTAYIESNDTKQPAIRMDQKTDKITHKFDKYSKNNHNDKPRILTSTADSSTTATTSKSNIKKFNENFERLSKKKNNIIRLQQKEQRLKLGNIVPQYRTNSQLDAIKDKKAISENRQMVPQAQKGFIIERNPWFQQPYPRNMYTKPPFFVQQPFVRSYSSLRHQHSSVPGAKEVLFRKAPELVEKNPNIFWSFLQL